MTHTAGNGAAGHMPTNEAIAPGSVDASRRDWRPVLLYRATCLKCRLLSGLLVVLALGTLRRVANSSGEAERILRLGGGSPRKVALFDGRRLSSGSSVLLALGPALFRGWARGLLGHERGAS